MAAIGQKEREENKKLLARECDNLLNEIRRLESTLNMQERRLENVMARKLDHLGVPNVFSILGYIGI